MWDALTSCASQEALSVWHIPRPQGRKTHSFLLALTHHFKVKSNKLTNKSLGPTNLVCHPF